MTEEPPRGATSALVNGRARRIVDRLHLWVAVLVMWLLVTSPWVSMLRQIPAAPGFFDYAHIGVGAATLVLTLAYSIACCRNGGWRLYFPWAAGHAGVVLGDLAGLFRGRVPSAEGGGLFGAIEGLTLLALLIVGITGVAWLWATGTAHALDWRDHHIIAARVLLGLVVLHAVSVSLHVLDFVRD